MRALIAAGLAALLPAAPPAAPEGPPGGAPAVRLAYRYAAGQLLRQTTRQVQTVTSEADPSLDSESVSLARAEIRVIEVDGAGTAILDEVTRYEDDPEKVEHKRSRVTSRGEVLWVDIVRGEPSALQGGALFPARPVRPGETWKTRLTAGGAGPRYAIALDVKLIEVRTIGSRRIAALDLKGRMDPASSDAMLGESAHAQGIHGKGCRVTGSVSFDVEAGRDAASTISLECALEFEREGKPPAAATLLLAYETAPEGPIVPPIPAP